MVRQNLGVSGFWGFRWFLAYFYAFLDFTTGTDFIWGETPLLNTPIAEIKLIATCRVAYHCTVQEKIIASQVAIAAFIEVCRLAVYDYAQCGVCVCANCWPSEKFKQCRMLEIVQGSYPNNHFSMLLVFMCIWNFSKGVNKFVLNSEWIHRMLDEIV